MSDGIPKHGSTGPARPLPLRLVASVVGAGAVAVVAMLAVGYVFNQVESAFPSIQAEYASGPGFRDWPGWSEGYMLVHPIWFGFVFAAGFAAVTRGHPTASWVAACCRGAVYGGLLFAVGSLPIFALVFASFRVSPELVAVSWAGRNLAQYLVAGVCVGIVMQAACTVVPKSASRN